MSDTDDAGFEDVAAEDEVRDGALLGVRVNHEPVVLLRVEGRIRATGGVCTHRAVLLEEDGVQEGPEGTRLTCLRHYATYDARTGAVLEGPAVTPLPCHEVRIEGGRVLVSRRSLPCRA